MSPIADTTTTTSCPACFVRITRSATCLMRATSATLDPPYFWTTMDTTRRCHETRENTKHTKPNRSVFFVSFVLMLSFVRFVVIGRR